MKLNLFAVLLFLLASCSNELSDKRFFAGINQNDVQDSDSITVEPKGEVPALKKHQHRHHPHL